MGLLRRDLDERVRDAVAGSVVMVTGASSGIGAATARALATSGATVVLVARSEDRLRAVERDVIAAGGTASVMPADLSDPVATKALIDEVLRVHGGVDALVSNAGRSIRRSVQLSYDRLHDYQRTMDVNYLGPVQLVLGLLPVMRERRRGHLVNVSTLGVLFSAPRFSAYLASKAAFDAFLRSIAAEVHGDGVAVTSIYLPLVRTPMIEATQVYGMLPGLTPDAAARRVLRALADRPTSIAPRFARLGSAAYDLAPGVFAHLLERVYRVTTDSAAARGDDDASFEAPRFEATLGRVARASAWRKRHAAKK